MAKILDPKPQNEPKGPVEKPYDPPPPGSEVGKKYAALGGMKWAMPGGKFTKMRGRPGAFQHFLPWQALSAPMSIYWTPETGAHVLVGDIRWAWFSAGAEKNVVGCPTSDEMVTHDGAGRFQTFERGQYVWHPETGAHEVHGAILERYSKLKGSWFGYPSTDELAAADGRGRFNHFRDVAGRSDRSIYWTQKTGAHGVYGFIRTAWMKAGGETGRLGYPTSEETDTHNEGGRFQLFEHGLIVWHPALGAFVIDDPIAEAYLDMDGTKYGYPLTNVRSASDGRGRYIHFRRFPEGDERSIYWTPTTGARPVYGFIRTAWMADGAEKGPTGYPTSVESKTHDSGGRVQAFERGCYVWHPEHGAHGLHGELCNYYLSTGIDGTEFGYPVTDQRTAKGGGQYADFHHLATKRKASIYWSPAHGAVEVYGEIRERWVKAGREKGHLGYPTSPEAAWAETPSSDGRVQQFEGGRIIYTGADGAAADPMRWTKELPKGGIGGHVEATMTYGDGNVHFHTYVKGRSWQAYNYNVHALLKADNDMAVASSKSSSVSSTHAGDDRNHHNADVSSTLVTSNYWSFDRGDLIVDEEHWGKVTGFIGDMVEGLVKFAIGSVVFYDPTMTLLLIAGAEVAAAIGGSAPGGMQIIGHTLFLAGPNGTIFALAAEAIAALATDERGLRDHEWAIVDALFKGTVPRDRIRITNAKGFGQSVFTYPGADEKVMINMGQWYDDPLTVNGIDRLFSWNAATNSWVGPLAPGQVFIHELVHGWQYINHDASISYVTEAVWSSTRGAFADDWGEIEPGRRGLRAGEAGYNLPAEYYPGTLGKDWDSYELEQQAVIVSWWFARHYTGGAHPIDRDGNPLPTPDGFGLSSAAAVQDDAYEYIRDHIRLGIN